MPDRKEFNLGDYVQVKDRIALFYELFGQGRLVTLGVQLTTEPDGKPRVMVEAAAYRTPDDPLPGRGWSWLELPGNTPYTKGSELENAETSAWGRAIASLGILIDKSIASAQEVDSKNGHEERPAEQRTTHRDGLIGKLIAQGQQDAQLRQGPDGPVLPFRVKAGRLSQIAVATGPIATAIDTYRDEVLGQLVTVWGTYSDETYPKGGADITYKVLHVERIKTPAFEMPVETGLSVSEALDLKVGEYRDEADSLPVWEPLTDDEKEAIAGGLPPSADDLPGVLVANEASDAGSRR